MKAVKTPPDADSSGAAAEREMILTAAERIFDELGVIGSTLDHIASDAGLSRNAVLKHFANKREMVVVYVERWADQRRAEAEQLRDDHPNDPRAVLIGSAALLDVPNGTVPGRSWVHFAAEMVRSHPVRGLVVQLRQWYVEFLAGELRKLGHRNPEGTAAALLMFHTGAMTAGALEGVTVDTAREARRLYAVLVDNIV
jgi:AcrR family transcriptional regulator